MDIFERLLERIVRAEAVSGAEQDVIVLTGQELDAVFDCPRASQHVDLRHDGERLFGRRIVLEDDEGGAPTH